MDNLAENAARPVAVGRKNYLFCQNDDTAESTAIIYSFMGCCKAAGVDFRTWMIYFLDHVHDYDEDYTKDIADLLPDNLKEAGLLWNPPEPPNHLHKRHHWNRWNETMTSQKSFVLYNTELTDRLQANVDDRNPDVFNVLSKDLFGKLYADKGYISKTLFESNMKNKLMPLRDKILLRKKSVIETINDELKNIAHAVHSRHRGLANFLMNMISALMAYSFFPKKPAIKWEIEKQNQLELFF